MAAPTESPDPGMERAALAERLMLHLQGSIEAFQRDALASLQNEFWSQHVREPGATMETLEAVLHYQAQLVTDLCDEMHDLVIQQCTPLAAMVTDNVSGWARALQVEATRVPETPAIEALVQARAASLAEPEKTLTPVEQVPARAGPAVDEQRSWRMQWRDRHGITWRSRYASPRRSTSQTRTQEQTRDQGYRE